MEPKEVDAVRKFVAAIIKDTRQLLLSNLDVVVESKAVVAGAKQDSKVAVLMALTAIVADSWSTEDKQKALLYKLGEAIRQDNKDVAVELIKGHFKDA